MQLQLPQQLQLQQQVLVEAEQLYQHALAIREQAFGEEAPLVGDTRVMLAKLYLTQGRQAEADALYQRVLRITNKPLNPQRDAAGGAEDQLYDFESDSIARPKPPPDNRFVRMTESLNNQAQAYANLGEHAKAEAQFKQLVNAYEKTGLTNDKGLAVILESYTALLRRVGRLQEADATEARAKNIRLSQ